MGQTYRNLKAGQASAETSAEWRDPADRIVPGDVQRLRLDIRARLEKGAQAAAASGKPLQILIGEDHGDNRAFLKEMIAVDEARRIGIRDLGREAPPGTPPPSPGIANNYASLLTLPGLFPEMRVHDLDSARDGVGVQAAASDETRSAAMAQNLSGVTGGSVAVVGIGHVDRMLADPALANHTVVALNVSDDGGDWSQLAKPIAMRGDARAYGYADLVRLGLGETRARSLLAQQEKQGLVSSPKAVAANAAFLEAHREGGHLTPVGHLALANGYSELHRLTGQDGYAGQVASLLAGLSRGEGGPDLAQAASYAINGAPRAVRSDPALQTPVADAAPQQGWAARWLHFGASP